MTLSSTAGTGVGALWLVSQTARAEEGSWTATGLANAPLARDLHTAVWTGSRMIVWGGNGYGGALNTGALYDPATDTWTPTSAVNGPMTEQTPVRPASEKGTVRAETVRILDRAIEEGRVTGLIARAADFPALPSTSTDALKAGLIQQPP